ncbi:MAG: 2,3-bisphosphoglycerate-independent phosphoglycerate mutase [Deltaproteobacteria bacterium]|nr:2,3-bisphosphoglycerate-independent phosphoglycerate mutase [Deltaproteobacteria bacterium]
MQHQSLFLKKPAPNTQHLTPILLLILDGLADRPQAVLGGKTPLEAARTPHLDRLAELGSNGLLVPLAPGVPLESETSHFILFGYPLEKFPGRAAFEAMGRGFDIPAGTVVLLASFATTTTVDGKVRRDAILWEEKRPRDEDDCEALSAAIAAYETQGLQFSLQACGRCEAILTLSGNPSRYLSDVDPFSNGALVARAQPLEEDPDQENAERTAAALNEYLQCVHHRLQAHPLSKERQVLGLPPINFLLTKWAAVRPQVPPFHEQNGLRAASVENYPLYIGLARVCGMTPVTVPHHTSVAADFREKLHAVDTLFRQGYEFVHVHSKGPDVAAHQKDPLGKRDAIEAIDSVLGLLVKQIESGADLFVVVTGDHATPSSGPLIHSGEAVPLLIAGGPNVLADDVKEFHERAAIHGGLGRVYGADLMPILLNLTDRVRLHGVRHQRQARPYWQRRPEPFIVSPRAPRSVS